MPGAMDLRVALVIAELLDSNAPSSLSELARARHLSRRRLEELFRIHTSVDIRTFVMCLRLHRAAALLTLCNPTISVKTVQYEVGYSDAGTFSRQFRRHFGIAPSFLRGLSNLGGTLDSKTCVLKGLCPLTLVTAMPPAVMPRSPVASQLLLRAMLAR